MSTHKYNRESAQKQKMFAIFVCSQQIERHIPRADNAKHEDLLDFAKSMHLRQLAKISSFLNTRKVENYH